MSTFIIAKVRSNAYSAPFDLQVAAKTLKAHGRKWSTLREQFKLHDVRPGAGWDEFIAKLAASHEDYAAVGSVFETIYREQILLGSRSCRVYNDDTFEWQTLIDRVQSFPVLSTSFGNSYPLPLSTPILKGLSSDTMELVSRELLHNGDLKLVFCSPRKIVSRQQLNPNQLSQQFTDRLATVIGGFDSLIALTSTYAQAYDVVVVRPSMARMEIRLDHPHTMDADVVAEQCTRILQLLEQIYSGVSTIMTAALNFFPIIGAMYLDRKCGVVEQLWFGTDTSSLKREVMRKTKLDLRDENFHVGGVTKLGGSTKIKPYAIRIHFDKLESKDSQVRVALHGNFKDLSIPAAVLSDVSIENCLNETEFRAALKRLVAFS